MIETCYVVGYDSTKSIKTVKVTYNSKVVSAQLLYPYLGSNYKHIWQPKIGTKVLVYFSGNVADNGIVLGYLEKVNDDPLLSFSDDGDKEIFQHENGTKIEFTNSNNKRKLQINTPKDDKINIDLDNQSLEIKSSDENTYLLFDFKRSKIELKSNELSIETTKNIDLKTSNMKIESSDTFKIQSGSFNLSTNKSIDLNSTSTINIKGQNINLN